MESLMAKQHCNNLLVLPWDEPGKWVFQNSDTSANTAVCSTPELHVNRSIPRFIRCAFKIAKSIHGNDCVVTWESSAAVATSLALKMKRSNSPWVALGITPKFTNRLVGACLSSVLRRASVVTCFSRADIATLASSTGLLARDVTPTVWEVDHRQITEKSKDWVAIGDSNRDDITLARAAELSGITIDRFTRKQAVTSPAVICHRNGTPAEVENAFHTYRHHLAVLKTPTYASGLSIAVRAGFARQLLIASNTPHMREMVTDGETGLLVDVGDIGQLANTIRSVERGEVDTEKLSRGLHQVCLERHSYTTLRRHIEEMVSLCS